MTRRTTVNLDDESIEIFGTESKRMGLTVSAFLRVLARRLRGNGGALL
jgi:hypothetical protein